MFSNLMECLVAAFGAVKEEKGQAMVEYALIIALVSIAAIVALGPLGLGGAIVNTFNSVVAQLPA
jgi:Flp pilus assembly pilin Flp